MTLEYKNGSLKNDLKDIQKKVKLKRRKGMFHWFPNVDNVCRN